MSGKVRAIVHCDVCGCAVTGNEDESVLALRVQLEAKAGWQVAILAPSGNRRDVCGVCVSAGKSPVRSD